MITAIITVLSLCVASTIALWIRAVNGDKRHTTHVLEEDERMAKLEKKLSTKASSGHHRKEYR